MRKSFYDQSYGDLLQLFKEAKLKPGAASLLFNWHYKKKKSEPLVKDLSKAALDYIRNTFTFDLPEIVFESKAQDRTVKFLMALDDGARVESVLIPFQGKYSLCVSSQAGCAMKCSFCHTGQQGLARNLETREIVGQYLQAWKWLAKNRPGEERILNIVFMGQGEPLHNFDAVKKACEIFVSQHGTSLASQKITVSTCGYLPGLRRWKREMPAVNLALSLHSPFASKRTRLIPVNKAYPLEEVLKEIERLPLAKKQFVTYEYLLIKDYNDGEEDVAALGELLRGKRALVNLIPFNPIPGSEFKRPGREEVEKFKSGLEDYGFPCMIRGTKGDDVMAACGQLNSAAN